jgi:hypothetical protein
MDIRTDLANPEKSSLLLQDTDLHVLLCARSIITELASTSLIANVVDSLFDCPCQQQRLGHAWRRLLIGQVALNLELAGYDELSAEVAARYLAVPKCVDSLAVRASLQRVMETAATVAEHEAQAEHWQPPALYQLDASVDQHTLHRWMVHQFMQ